MRLLLLRKFRRQSCGIIVVLLFPVSGRLLDAINVHVLVGLDGGIGSRKLLLHAGQLGFLRVELVLRHIAAVSEVHELQLLIRCDGLFQLLESERSRVAVLICSKKCFQVVVHGFLSFADLV